MLAAPPDEAQRKKIARELADLAYEQYTAGDYTGAIETFKRADETYHAPTLVYALAKAHAKARHLLAARALLDKVIAERLPPGAPDAFLGAQRSAREEAKALASAIPTLEVRLGGAVPAAGVTVTIDDGPATPGAPTDLDPGKHQVTVTYDGGRETRSVVLAEGAHASIVVDLVARAGVGRARRDRALRRRRRPRRGHGRRRGDAPAGRGHQGALPGWGLPPRREAEGGDGERPLRGLHRGLRHGGRSARRWAPCSSCAARVPRAHG